MSAIQTPDDDAPAVVWGAFAERIPGWRWPPVASHSTQMRDLWIEVGSPIGDLPSPRSVIDPDHWAWEGWLRRMLGETLVCVAKEGRGWSAIVARGDLEGYGTTPGRAAIAAAAANGRWPGGGV